MKYSKRRGNTSITIQPSSLTLDEALRVFVLAHDAVGHSNATKKDYKAVVGIFIRYLQSEKKYSYIEQVKEADILEWLSFLRTTNSSWGRPFSSRSIGTYGRDVKVFFRWLVEHQYLETNPMNKVERLKEEKTLIRVFTEDELVRMDAACDRPPKGRALTPDERKSLASRDRAFLWLLLSTGIRVSEACGLLFSDIDWNMGMIYVRGKGAKERKVPFGKVARQHLNSYIRFWRGESQESDEHVFLNAFGIPLRVQPAWRIFERLKRIAGIRDKRVSPHTCRHWFAVNAIKNGVPSTVLQGWLGHATLTMVNVYVHLAEQDNHDLYTKFSPVDSLEMHKGSSGRRQQNRDWRNTRKREK
jgi:site-specific recombinase XerD